MKSNLFKILVLLLCVSMAFFVVSCKKKKDKNQSTPSVPTQSEIESEIEQTGNVKTLNIITFITLLFSILSAICFPIALKIIFTIVGTISFISYWAIRSQVSNEIYFEKANKKKNTLITLLKKKGIAIPKKLQGGLK